MTQLNEIEARKEEYPETLAFIRLLNELMGAALLKGSIKRTLAGVPASGASRRPSLDQGQGSIKHTLVGVPASGAVGWGALTPVYGY